MPKYKTTEEILKVISDRNRVRNFGIIAHVDHGKTTLSDSLLSASGLLSPDLAGEARALDYLEEEQKRGITIKTANVSLLYEQGGKSYVLNLIDTPGHVDFTGKVTRALRAIDTAVVVVDAVEEIMTQTETVTRQALGERVRPLLFINKIDRLINELKLTPQEMQKKLARIISGFNNLITMYGEPEFREKWKVSPIQNNVAFGSARDKWGFTLEMAQRKGFTFNDIIKYYRDGRVDELRKELPLHEAVLDMVVKHGPSPIEAQKYRIPKIWSGDLDSEIGQAMLNCNPNGPIMFMITNVIFDPHAGPVSVGRLMSGTVREGDEVYLINNRSKDRVLQVSMFMGPYRENVREMIAGNIPALLGLEKARAGETISSIPDVVPFEAIKYISEPVVTMAIEPKHSRDLPKLIEALRRLTIEDPNLHVKINQETGEYLLSGMGTLHLEIAIHMLQDQGLEVTTSLPIVVYRETVKGKSSDFPGKSPNKHNKFLLRVEPLESEIVEMITSGKLTDDMDKKRVAKILFERGWPTEEARNVWCIDERGNMLINVTKGVQYLDEAKSMIISAFKSACEEGVLAKEPVRGMKVLLLDAELHEDPAHRTFAQIFPAIRRAIYGAFLEANPTLLEPQMLLSVQVPAEYVGTVTSIISSKRGVILGMDHREYFVVVNGELPISETFDLSQVLRGATAGRAFWQMTFRRWGEVPQSLLPKTLAEIRRRKGLPEGIPRPEEFRPT